MAAKYHTADQCTPTKRYGAPRIVHQEAGLWLDHRRRVIPPHDLCKRCIPHPDREAYAVWHTQRMHDIMARKASGYNDEHPLVSPAWMAAETAHA